MVWSVTAIAGVSLAIWLYLVALRGGFWRADRRLDEDLAAPPAWPAVVALVPARDEAEVIGRSVAALLAQDYPGRFRVVLIDDHSRDGTAEVALHTAEIARHTAEAARHAAGAAGAAERLSVVAARALPPGWSGKLWALSEGLAHAEAAQIAGLDAAEAHKFFGRPRGLDRPDHPHLKALPPGAAKARYLERFKTLTLGARL